MILAQLPLRRNFGATNLSMRPAQWMDFFLVGTWDNFETEIVSKYFLRVCFRFSCVALRREPCWGREGGIDTPAADRVFRSVGPWRGLTDANLQQIIRTFRIR